MWRMKKIEGFETTATGAAAPAAAPAAPAAAPAVPAVYVEDITSLPKATTVKYYLTSFSDNTNYSHRSYVPEENKWYNYIEEASFNLVGRLPNEIRSVLTGEDVITAVGLPIKPVKMIGPASSLATCSTRGAANLELGSFTVCFFGRLNALELSDTNRAITLFQMFAENPNHIRWSITHRDATNCYIEVVLGNVNTTYRWLVPKSTILSNGNATLYSLVYSVFDVKRTITVYIGTNKYVASSTDMTPIRMGNTPMEINSTSNLDMILQAFVYSTTAFAETDLPVWTEYFIQQSGGLARTLKFLKDTYATEITNLSSKLSDQTNSVEDLQKLLDECRAKIPALAGLEEKKAKWQIKMDGDTSVSADESKQCSLLGVPSPFKKSGTAGTTGTTTGAAGATEDENESGLHIVSPVPKK
jgi:hypothetical protein